MPMRTAPRARLVSWRSLRFGEPPSALGLHGFEVCDELRLGIQLEHILERQHLGALLEHRKRGEPLLHRLDLRLVLGLVHDGSCGSHCDTTQLELLTHLPQLPFLFRLAGCGGSLDLSVDGVKLFLELDEHLFLLVLRQLPLADHVVEDDLQNLLLLLQALVVSAVVELLVFGRQLLHLCELDFYSSQPCPCRLDHVESSPPLRERDRLLRNHCLERANVGEDDELLWSQVCVVSGD
mmetsp:Transcript_27788/g.89799  ORF Transcript_27788/g.89799 Transcript_27788/m.89799 type:complete len:237 (+) Transcript_27788:464-1174(+)